MRLVYYEFNCSKKNTCIFPQLYFPKIKTHTCITTAENVVHSSFNSNADNISQEILGFVRDFQLDHIYWMVFALQSEIVMVFQNNNMIFIVAK